VLLEIMLLDLLRHLIIRGRGSISQRSFSSPHFPGTASLGGNKRLAAPGGKLRPSASALRPSSRLPRHSVL